MRIRALVYFYVRRIRIHMAQELLAGAGIAVAVALVFSVMVANGSITDSANEVVHAVIGPADLQLHARGPGGFDGRLLRRVERLPGVKQAAPLLEETATVIGPGEKRVNVNVAGTNVSLALLDGLAHTLPLGALTPGGIGLSKASADALGLDDGSSPTVVALKLRGHTTPLRVSAVLGRETAGALAQAQVAVMSLAQLQQLADLQGRVTRILVESAPGRHSAVRNELTALADGHITVAAANQDVSLLHQALRPSNQASELFAGLSALLGFLFAFNAMLLTVPERREAIADLRLDGTPRLAIVQMIIFQALCLGLVASLFGLFGGYVLSLGFFHQSPTYLTKAFTLGTNTKIGPKPVLLALGGGLLAACLASMVPLGDLLRGRPVDGAFQDSHTNTRGPIGAKGWLATATVCLVLLASALFLYVPSAAILACVSLAVATMLAVPLALATLLRVAETLARRYQNLTVLPLALSSLKTTTLRSLALAAMGAVALFGSVALGASRDDLLRGIDGYTHHYVHSADIWLVNPSDNQAIDNIATTNAPARIARVLGVTSIHAFQGSFLDLGDRRVWVIAWPPAVRPELLEDQIVRGSLAGAMKGLRTGGSITLSDQIANEYHLKVGDSLSLPTPTGSLRLRVAATTTNFGWSPGAILMSTQDYMRGWASSAASAFGVELEPGTNAMVLRGAIAQALGPTSGLEVLTSTEREDAIDASASEGLGQLNEISTLLVAAAILAMAAALGSSIWQQRQSIAELRLEGAPGHQLQLLLLVESALMLSAGCLTGAIAGIYGRMIIDGYLRRVTGFPVAGVTTSQRPIEIFALVITAVLLIVSLPGWFASRVPATLALSE